MKQRWIVAALVFCLAQIAMALLVQPSGSFVERYQRLVQWDGLWYQSIASTGYHFTTPLVPPLTRETNNTGFFPGLPVLTQIPMRVLGLESGIALVLTAQVCALAFWIYFFLVLQNLGVGYREALVAGFGVFVFPGSFYLAVGYTESVALAAGFGLLYWFQRAASGTACSEANFFISAGHGVLLTAAQPRGFLLCSLLFLELARRPELFRKALAVCVVASSGALLFLGYCDLRLGAWDAYRQTQVVAFAQGPVPWFAPFYLKQYSLWVSMAFFTGELDAMRVSRFLGTLLAAGSVIFLLRVRFRNRSFKLTGVEDRTAVLCAGLCYVLLCLQSANLTNGSFPLYSMLRYGIPVAVLLSVLGALEVPRRGLPLLVAASVPALWVQARLIYAYVTSYWIA